MANQIRKIGNILVNPSLLAVRDLLIGITPISISPGLHFGQLKPFDLQTALDFMGERDSATRIVANPNWRVTKSCRLTRARGVFCVVTSGKR